VRGILAGLQCYIHYLILHPSHKQDTGVGKNSGYTTATIHISLSTWCWTTFCIQYSRNPSWNGLLQVLNSLWWNCIQLFSKNIFKNLSRFQWPLFCRTLPSRVHSTISCNQRALLSNFDELLEMLHFDTMLIN
jgi:hypothetical protein